MIISLFFTKTEKSSFLCFQADQNVERFDTPADLDELKTANKEVIGKEKDADQPNAAKNLQDARAVIGTDKLIATEEDVVNAKDADRLDVAKHLQGVQAASDVDKLIADKDEQSCPAEDLDELEDAKDDLKLKLAKEFVELKSKLHDMDSKLREVSLFVLTWSRCLLKVSGASYCCPLKGFVGVIFETFTACDDLNPANK